MTAIDDNTCLLEQFLLETRSNLTSWDDLPTPAGHLREKLFQQVFPPAKAQIFLSQLPRANDNALVVADCSGIVEWVSPAFTRMCGYTQEELRGQKPGKILQGKETSPEAVALLREGVRNQSPAIAELVNYHKNGDRYVVKIALNPLFSSAGECTGFIAVEHQIS